MSLLSHDHPVSEGALGHSFREIWKMLGLEWNQYIGMLCCSLICISYKYEVIHGNTICKSAITISDNNSKDHNDTGTLLSYLSIHTKSTYTNMYKFWYANDILMCAGKKHFSFQINTFLTPCPTLQTKDLQNSRIMQEWESISQSFCFVNNKSGRSLNSRDADVIRSCHKV